MKITVDTQVDSHEDIRKAIRMLQSLVQERGGYSNQGDIFASGSSFGANSPSSSSSDPQPMNAFGAMFGDSGSANLSSSANEEVKPEPKKSDDYPQIIPY